MIRFAFVFAILLAIASSASAADPATNQAAGLPAPTATFVAMAAAGNLFEIQSSELALRRSHSGAVREFANRMVTDHNAAAAKFKQAMADAKLTPPAEKLDISTALPRCVTPRTDRAGLPFRDGSRPRLL